MSDLNAPQPAPVSNTSTPIWELVIEDMKRRNELGIERYGTPLQAHNGRIALLDLYQELLDAAVYCRQEMKERENWEAKYTMLKWAVIDLVKQHFEKGETYDRELADVCELVGIDVP